MRRDNGSHRTVVLELLYPKVRIARVRPVLNRFRIIDEEILIFALRGFGENRVALSIPDRHSIFVGGDDLGDRCPLRI